MNSSALSRSCASCSGSAASWRPGSPTPTTTGAPAPTPTAPRPPSTRIFGTFVEFSVNNTNDPGDYHIGEEIMKDRPALRYMDKPSKDGNSVDCWRAGVGNLDVHYSSGVGNHFVYLAAEGSGRKEFGGIVHDSPTCNGSTVTGIGRDKVGKIWFRALTTYMTTSTNYAQARTATLNAATDLYGADSPEPATVAAAWSAVSVN